MMLSASHQPLIADIQESGAIRSKPYKNKIFPLLLGKLFFKKPTDIGRAFSDRFFSSLDGNDELEMSLPMLSFVAVIVCENFYARYQHLMCIHRCSTSLASSRLVIMS